MEPLALTPVPEIHERVNFALNPGLRPSYGGLQQGVMRYLHNTLQGTPLVDKNGLVPEDICQLALSLMDKTLLRLSHLVEMGGEHRPLSLNDSRYLLNMSDRENDLKETLVGLMASHLPGWKDASMEETRAYADAVRKAAHEIADRIIESTEAAIPKTRNLERGA